VGAGGRAGGVSDPAAFKAFEADGWSARAGTYDALMARATAFAIGAAVPTMPISPTPLTPSGLISSSLLFDEDHVDRMNIRIRRHIRPARMGRLSLHAPHDPVIGV